MNAINKQMSSARALHFGVLLFMLCAAMPTAWAKQHNPDSSQAIGVVARVQFDGKAVKDMSIQTQANGTRYLYVEHLPEQGISILDIGRPSQPTLVGSVAWPGSASGRGKDVTAEAMLQRFANVNRVLADDRGYVYILNDDGLWVISTPAAYLQNQPNPFQTFWVCAEYAHDAQAPCTQGY